MFIIGFVTAVIAFAIDISILLLANQKYTLIKKCILPLINVYVHVLKSGKVIIIFCYKSFENCINFVNTWTTLYYLQTVSCSNYFIVLYFIVLLFILLYYNFG